DGVVIDRNHFDGNAFTVDGLHEHGCVACACFGVGDDLVEREFHVSCGERRAVVPGDAFAQVERVDEAVVTDVPAGGQAGDEFVILEVELYEGVENLLGKQLDVVAEVAVVEECGRGRGERQAHGAAYLAGNHVQARVGNDFVL